MKRYLAVLGFALLLGGCNQEKEKTEPIEVTTAQSIDVPLITLTPDEQEFVKNHKIVTWAVEENRPPGVYIDETAQVKGRVPTYLAVISKMTGLVFKPIPVGGLGAGIEAVKSGQIDLVTSVRPTTDRSHYLGFTAPFADNKGVFVFGNSPKPNSPLRVGVQAGDSAKEYLEQNFPGMTVVETEEYEECLVLLQRKSLDLVMMNEATADFLFKKFGMKLHKVQTDFNYQTTFGFKKDNLLLGSIMSKAILAISIEDKNKINESWKEEDLSDKMLERRATPTNATTPAIVKKI